ncbi:hypothetical protein F4778DRAFT_794751 [Xylariomycetidae sp. FL2044]|nr:hypothetical protein F4778DRAFT_794751 [Xylariomycetidae sp. FL2044]
MADIGTPPSIVPMRDSVDIANGSALTAQSRSVKRPRPVKSCLECRRRKLRCDRTLPCSQCQKSQRSCRYAADGEPASQSDESDAETPERATKRPFPPGQDPKHRPQLPTSHPSNSVIDEHAARIERLEKLLLANAKSPSLSEDSTRQPRPVASATTIRGLTVKGGLRTRFFGQNSTPVLLNLFEESKEFIHTRDKSPEFVGILLAIQNIHRAQKTEHEKVTTPITVFVDSMTPIQKRMADVLPSRTVCDHLLQVYFNSTETVYRVLHVPSFMEQYSLYWEGNSQPDSFLPILLPVLCLGYRLIGIGKGGLYHDREGIHIPTACALVRTWLDGLRGKSLIEFTTLQAEVLLLMAQRMINPQNQQSWTHLGLIVRMAMTMGFHRDPAEFRIPVFWAELRRRVWYTILELDVHMSLQCNLPSCIREGDFTCQPPRNLNDKDIYAEMEELPPGKPIEQDTDSRMQVFAATTLAARFKVLDLVNRMERLQSYQQVLELGNELERVLEDIRYVIPQSQTAELQDVRRVWMTRVILDINIRRALLGLYRPFALSCTDAPQQIMTGYLRSSIKLTTYLDELPLDPNTPDYQHIWHMHHIVLKQDVLQAAFSVCHYMKHTNSNCQSPQPSNWDSSSTPDSVEEACTIATQSSVLVSLPRQRAAVEGILDAMIKRIREIGMDLKDIVMLTIVYHTYQPGTKEQKLQAMKEGMLKIVNAGIQSTLGNQDSIALMPTMQSPISVPLGSEFPSIHAGINQMYQQHFSTDMSNIVCEPLYNLFKSSSLIQQMPDDVTMWDMEFWNPSFAGPS